MSLASAFIRLRQRNHAEQRLIMRTAVLFVLAHLYLRAASLDGARKRLTHAAKRMNIRVQNAEQLSWLIAAVNRNLPGKHSCLIDAVCCESIAQNSGLVAELKLGAARGHDRMHFHAWVEHAGHIIAGAHDDEFTPLR